MSAGTREPGGPGFLPDPEVLVCGGGPAGVAAALAARAGVEPRDLEVARVQEIVFADNVTVGGG